MLLFFGNGSRCSETGANIDSITVIPVAEFWIAG